MSRAPSSFRETDLRRALKAIAGAGQSVRGVRFLKDGGFLVIFGEPDDGKAEGNEWDEDINDAAQAEIRRRGPP
jgi:hypothetical protein